ncbi:MAG: hypothetical protein AAFQ28_14135 [Pseudomonadota bacterium]
MTSEGERQEIMQARVPYIDRIWRAASSIELDTQVCVREAYERLAPLFDTQGTEVVIDGNAMTYAKTNPVAQDKLATFTSGTLVITEDEAKTRLSYDVGSTALFLCFLAPLAFLALGQFAVFLNEIERPAYLSEKAEREAEKDAEKDEAIELHWVDQMLGAPAPKQPGEEDETSRREDARGGEDREDEGEGYHSPKTAYAFAGIFAAIYLVGRVLEPYLLKKTFRNALSLAQAADKEDING